MKYALSLIAALTLAACSPQPPQTSGEKLAGKSSEEQRTALRRDCLNEAERLGNHFKKDRRTHRGAKLNQDTPQTRRLKDLCFELVEEYQPAGKSSEGRRAELAEQCHREIASSVRPGHPADTVSAEAMRQICEKATGLPVKP